MANTQSAIKRVRSNERKRQRNRLVRARTRTVVRSAVAGLEDEQPDTNAVKAAVSALDRAAQRGTIHPNNAARRKSRLMKKLAAAKPQA